MSLIPICPRAIILCAHLKERGADVDAEVARMGDPVPPMFWFRDPDGNSPLVVEQR